jgi:hypothetical protein
MMEIQPPEGLGVLEAERVLQPTSSAQAGSVKFRELD